jgi:hypothetical protein
MSTYREIILRNFPDHADRIFELATIELGLTILDAETKLSASDVLASVFTWEDSSEGHRYWSDLYKKASS